MYKQVGEVDGGGELPAGGRLYSLLGLFGVAMGLRSASHRPKHKPRWTKMSHYHWSKFQTHASHAGPFMGPMSQS